MPGLQDIGIGLGIILTAVGLIFSIRKWQVSQKAQQPNIVAKLTHGFIRYATEISPAMLLLKVIHGGGKSVRIVSVVLTFKGKNLVFQDGIVGKTKFPFDISKLFIVVFVTIRFVVLIFVFAINEVVVIFVVKILVLV